MHRRFKDVVALSEVLEKGLPGCILPARPRRNAVGARRAAPKFLEVRHCNFTTQFQPQGHARAQLHTVLKHAQFARAAATAAQDCLSIDSEPPYSQALCRIEKHVDAACPVPAGAAGHTGALPQPPGRSPSCSQQRGPAPLPHLHGEHP